MTLSVSHFSRGPCLPPQPEDLALSGFLREPIRKIVSDELERTNSRKRLLDLLGRDFGRRCVVCSMNEVICTKPLIIIADEVARMRKPGSRWLADSSGVTKGKMQPKNPHGIFRGPRSGTALLVLS